LKGENMHNGIENYVADLAYIEAVKKLAVELATHFSIHTKRLAVPDGTRMWRIERVVDDAANAFYPPMPTKTIFIELIDFLGAHIGYNSEIDVLVCWENEKGEKK
jgi:hypothetical protein